MLAVRYQGRSGVSKLSAKSVQGRFILSFETRLFPIGMAANWTWPRRAWRYDCDATPCQPRPGAPCLLPLQGPGHGQTVAGNAAGDKSPLDSNE
jgi:hypothetical protein